jgi:hypothetical protein
MAGQPGGDLQSAGDLAESHFFQLAIAETIEETANSAVKFLGGFPFLLAVEGSAAGPIGGLPSVVGGVGLRVLLKESGLELLNAHIPAEAAGPSLEGIKFFAEMIGEGWEGAIVAEVKEREESAESARGFAGERREDWLRVYGWELRDGGGKWNGLRIADCGMCRLGNGSRHGGGRLRRSGGRNGIGTAPVSAWLWRGKECGIQLVGGAGRLTAWRRRGGGAFARAVSPSIPANDPKRKVRDVQASFPRFFR